MGEERDVYHFWYTAWSDFSKSQRNAQFFSLDMYYIDKEGVISYPFWKCDLLKCLEMTV